MASINQVSLEFSTKGERQAIQALKNLNLSTEKLKTTQVSASQAAARLDSQRKKETRELERLRGKYIQGHAAMEMYSREMNDLARARRANIISAEQQAAEVSRLNQVYRQGSTATGGFADANHIASRQTNAAGMAMQQAGYQVGDFVVQVQSGTNAFVAFGQQATQLVGVLPMLASQMNMNVNTLIKWSAGLGVVIPITTALAAAFMRMGDNASESSQDAKDDIEELSAAIGSLNEIQKATSEDFEKNLNAAFGDSAEKVGRLVAAINKVRFEESMEPVERAVEAVRFGIDAAAASMDRLSMISGMSALEKYLAGADDATIRRLQQQVQANIDLVNAQEEVRASLEAIQTSGSSRELVDNFANAFALLEGIGGPASEKMLAALVEAAKEAKVYEEVMRRGEAATEDTADGLNNVVSLSRTVTNETNKYISEMAEVFERTQDLREELGDAAFEALRLAGVDIESGIDDAAKAAAKLAADLNISLAAAIAMQNMASKEELVMSQPVVQGPATDRFGVEDLLNMGYTEDYLKSIGKIRDASGGSAQSTVDETDKLRESVNKLIASYDEEYAIKLKIEEATKLIAEAQRNDAIPANMEADQVLQDYIDSLRDVEDPMEDFANNSAKQMADAFVSIIDGSKSASDAFKDMARSILEQALRMAVINPIINSIFGGVGGFNPLPTFLANANGNAFNNGNVIPFANGGVVSSPTMFPMAGQQTGVMGEAGPEAIMPLKRGKGGKLGVVAEGGQGDVVINQSFNISANGDDSVKRIIEGEAPKLSAMALKTVMNERRKGGSMKQAFG